jgi:Na+/H+ antiporter NhaD/arsenite permease-like protein
MNNRTPKLKIALLIVLLAFILTGSILLPSGYAQNPREGYFISGQLMDPQDQPINEAFITATIPDETEPLGEAESQEEGTWVLVLAEFPQEDIYITIERPHFQTTIIKLREAELDDLSENGIYRIGTLVMDRKIDASFWIATAVFVIVLLLIALERLHSTTAALAGFSIIFLVSYIGGAFNPDLFIMSFEAGLDYINWNVIFLVMGMMVIIAVIENTGVFQWLAFQAYRLSGGRSWLLVLILMAITAVASALLDNFTTMLLMTPISLQIALALGINPLAFIIPEIMASNVGGISTLVGTPTNIIIGAYADISFTDFLVNQTVGVIIALVAMAVFILFHYRKDFRKSGGGISPRLFEKLKANAEIDEPDALWKSGIVFLLVLVGFIAGEQIHLDLAITAIAGAVLLLIWLKPDVQHMIKAVDWTTLVFFMALFVVVGAIQEVGLISITADIMARLIGENLVLGIFVIVFGVGTVSTVIANIPLAASMLPIVEFLSGSIPGASNKVLFYALSMGAAMGGNGTLIGGEANLVTAGITEQAGNPISFKAFLKVGLPVTYITLFVGFIWLLIRF